MWDLHQYPLLFIPLSLFPPLPSVRLSLPLTPALFTPRHSRRQEGASADTPDTPLKKTLPTVSLPLGHTSAYNLFITSYFCNALSPTKLQLPSHSSSILSVLSNVSLGRRIPALLFRVFENCLAEKALSLAAFLSAFDDCVSRSFCLPDSNGCIKEPGSLLSITEGISSGQICQLISAFVQTAVLLKFACVSRLIKCWLN